MADYLNQTLTTDSYDDCTVGPDFRTDHVTVTVDRNDILFQLAQGTTADWRWIDEREFHSIEQSFRIGNVVGFRAKSATPGLPAIIDVSLCGPADPDFSAGTPLQPGAVSSVIPRVDTLPSSPSDAQQCILDLEGAGWPGTEWLCIYNIATGYWDVLGPPLLVVAAAGGALSALPTAGGWYYAAGSLIAAPNAGDYQLECSSDFTNLSTGTDFSQTALNQTSGSAAANAQRGEHLDGTVDVASVYSAGELTSVAAGDKLGPGYSATTPANAYLQRGLARLTPIRIQ